VGWGAPYEHEQIQGSIKAKIGLALNRRLLLNAYKYSQKHFPIWAAKIEKYKPKVLYGYASIILEFANFSYKKDWL